MTLHENYQRVLESVKKANNNGRHITLVAVTKNRTVDEINKLLELGVCDIGENKVQEAEKKFPHLAKNVRKHMIGHLQSNKVKRAVELFDVIHSVDSEKVAQKISEAATLLKKNIDLFIEVNISGELSKSGIKVQDTERLHLRIRDLPNIHIIGLMTMAPLMEPEETRPIFASLKKLSDKLGLQELSMGMSNDFVVAVEEGATYIRVGTALFEP